MHVWLCGPNHILSNFVESQIMNMKRILMPLIAAMSVLSASGYTIIDGRLTDSAVYPSAVHNFKISVPEGYDGSPACLYVGLDGILCDAPSVIDTLIAEGSIPYIIGVYLQPGVVENASGTVLRYNRSNEFDATDGRFARFLETEVIPGAVRTAEAHGVLVRLKEGGANRMIFGLSSGGIGAFTAAWHRPDLFGRVFSGCGTFVPMRGGNDLQAVVRKSEPKPLRVFLQDGYSDTWNPLFGSWFEANQLLGSALEFAGYAYDFDWADGGHSVRRAAEIFPDVMRWMWKDYGAPAEVRKTGNGNVASWLEDSGGWTVEPAEEYAPNPVAIYPDGRLVARAACGSNYLVQSLRRPDGQEYAAQPYYWLHAYNNSTLRKGGMSFDADGYLWVITDAGLQVLDQVGRVRGIFELPLPLAVALVDDPARPLGNTRLEVLDGAVRVLTPDAVYVRKLNVRAPVEGLTPPAEGPA